MCVCVGGGGGGGGWENREKLFETYSEDVRFSLLTKV